METFASFMERVLYEKEKGYYQQNEHPASGKDYITASSHPLFSKAIINFIKNKFKNKRMDFVDIGAGDGRLLLNLKKNIKNEKIRFFGVEKLKRFKDEKIIFYDSIEKINKVEGIIFSFEFYDSLPFHLIEKKDGKIKEIYVKNEKFVTSDLSSKEILGYLEKYNIKLVEGQRIEVCLLAEKLYNILTEKLKNGLILTFDYGFKANILYKKSFFPYGTLMTHKENKMNRNPLEKPYEKDITCAVNFTALQMEGEKNGFKTINFISLSNFLIENLSEELKEIENFKHPILVYDLIFGKVGQDIKALIQEKI